MLNQEKHWGLLYSIYLFIFIFYRAALNAGRSSREKGVRPSVCLSKAWIVTKRKKNLSRFLYHMKDHLAKFSEKKNGWFLPKILGPTAPVRAKSPILNWYSLVASQP